MQYALISYALQLILAQMRGIGAESKAYRRRTLG